MTAKPTRTISQSRVQNLLDKAAGGCGGALNSFLVLLSDRGGGYATGPYSSDVDKVIVCDQAPSIAQKRTSSEATDGAPSLTVVVPQAKIGR